MDPQLIAALRANATAPTGGARTRYVNGRYELLDKPKTQGRGGFLSSLISELGGGAGAAGGAAIGTALLPGVGTILGAGIGGFLGGAGGRVAENEVRDSRIGLGDALKEGLFSGVLSGAGAGWQVAKGAKAAKAGLGAAKGGIDVSEIQRLAKIPGSGVSPKDVEYALANAGKISGQADDVLKATVKAPAQMGKVEMFGKNIKAGGMGLAQGASAPGLQAIGADQSDDLIKTVSKTFKIKPGSPEAMQRALEPKLAQLGEQISARYAQSNAPLTAKELNDLGARIIQQVTTQGGLDDAAEKYALSQAQRLTKAGDVNGLWKFTRDLEKNSINFARGASAASPAKESVARIIREEVRGVLDNKVPDIASLNATYHSALDANKLLIKGSKNFPGGGVVGKVSSLSPVKSAESKVGSAIERTGQALAGTGGPITKVTNQLVRQSPASLSRALGGMSQAPVEAASVNTGGYEPMQDPYSASATNSLQGGLNPQTTAAQSPYPLEAAIADMQRDPKNQAQYIQFYKFVNDSLQEQNDGGQPNISKVTAQQYSLAQRGAQSLQQLRSMLSDDPSVLTRTATPGRKLPVVGGFISKAAGTGEYDAIGYNIASALLRLETGAQANESEIRNLQTQLMPRAGDSPQTVQRKLQQLEQAFNTTLSAAQGGGGLANLIPQGAY